MFCMKQKKTDQILTSVVTVWVRGGVSDTDSLKVREKKQLEFLPGASPFFSPPTECTTVMTAQFIVSSPLSYLPLLTNACRPHPGSFGAFSSSKCFKKKY